MGPAGSIQSDNLAPDAYYLVDFHHFLGRVRTALSSQGGKGHAANDERAMERLVVQRRT